MITRLNNFDLAPLTTFGLPVRVSEFILYDTPEELAEVCGSLPGPPLQLGGGSNLLFATDSFDGTVVKRRPVAVEQGVTTAETDEPDDVLVTVEAGVNTDHFIAYCVDRGWHGLENLSLIPGDMGGATVQNIGAYGVELADRVEYVKVLSPDGLVTLPAADCGFGYRISRFKTRRKETVISTTLRLSRRPAPVLTYGPLRDMAGASAGEIREKIIEVRRAKLPDPAELGSAGSFFTNPVVSPEIAAALKAASPQLPVYEAEGGIKLAAGWLIENAGLKGKSIGGAMVYPKQCLVIVNTGDATWRDVISLMELVQTTVMERFGVMLHPEVNIIGAKV